MKVQDLILIYDYNYWSTKRLLAAAAKVSQEQLVAPAAFPHGSLRGTFVHLLDAEYGWRILCQQGLETEDLSEAEFPYRIIDVVFPHHYSDLGRADVAGATDDLV